MSSVISWSGGKDSCLALWHAQQSGDVVSHTLTALDETGLKTRSHGVSKELIVAQSKQLGLKPNFISATWKNYEQCFIDALINLKHQGVSNAIFGDIDLLAHKEWEEKVCSVARLSASLPLWNQARFELVEEFLDLGFKAHIVCVDARFLNESYVGVEFDQYFINNLPTGVDACGENGEFHTFVYDGPNFTAPVDWVSKGKYTYVSPIEYGQQTYYFDLLDVAL
jgi:uncharacterized protein (TIGR00290 family)